MFKRSVLNYINKPTQVNYSDAVNFNFEDSFRKSKAVFQYKCNQCKKKWWGAAKNNTCNKCSSIVNKLPFEKMTG